MSNLENLEEKEVILNIEELKSKYGKIYEVKPTIEELEKEFTFYFKNPTTASINRYIRQASKNQLSAGLDFADSCIIEEQKEEFTDACKKYVGISQVCTSKLLNFLGFTDNITAKKL